MVREIGEAFQDNVWWQRTRHRLQVMPRNTFSAFRTLVPNKMYNPPQDQIQPLKMQSYPQPHLLSMSLRPTLALLVTNFTMHSLLINSSIEDRRSFLLYHKTYRCFISSFALYIIYIWFAFGIVVHVVSRVLRVSLRLVEVYVSKECWPGHLKLSK